MILLIVSSALENPHLKLSGSIPIPIKSAIAIQIKKKPKPGNLCLTKRNTPIPQEMAARMITTIVKLSISDAFFQFLNKNCLFFTLNKFNFRFKYMKNI